MKTLLKVFPLLVVLVILLPLRANADFVMTSLIQEPTPVNSGRFGSQVDIDGDWMIGVTPRGTGAPPGRAAIFQRSGGVWNYQATVTEVSGVENTYGLWGAINGDWAIVSDHNNGAQAGAVYLYERSGISWNFNKKIVPSDLANQDFFGDGIDMSENFILVGSYRDDDLGSASGSAYLFEKNTGGANNWGQAKKLVASDGAANDWFGRSVSISENEDYLVVGAYTDDDGATDSGSAYVYYRNAGGINNWGQVKKLNASDPEATAWFGQKVDISENGEYIVVGAYGKDEIGANSGAAYLFGRDVGGVNNWGLIKKLTPSDGVANDRFGESVAVSGETVMVGSYRKSSFQGAVYVFRKDEGGVDNWGEQEILVKGNAFDDDFGIWIALEGDTAMIGADYYSQTVSAGGAVYYFLDTPAATPGFVITESGGNTSVTEGGPADSFEVVLSAQPTGNVVLDVVSDNNLAASVSPASLTFDSSNWNVPQIVNVNAPEDANYINESVQITVSVDALNSDVAYASVTSQNISVLVTDNDSANFSLSTPSLNITEGSGSSFEVVLSAQPSGDIVLNISSDNNLAASVSPATLTFDSSNWNVPQIVNVNAPEDANAVSETVQITVSVGVANFDIPFATLPNQYVAVSVTDNDSANFGLSVPSLTVVEGASGSFEVVLSAQPSSEVVVDIVSDNNLAVSVSPVTLTFDSSNWNVPQIVSVNALEDANYVNEIVNLTVTVNDLLSDVLWHGLAEQVVVTTSDNDTPPSGGSGGGGLVFIPQTTTSGGGGLGGGQSGNSGNSNPEVNAKTYEEELAELAKSGFGVTLLDDLANKCEALQMMGVAFDWEVSKSQTLTYLDLPEWCVSLAKFGTDRGIVEGRAPTKLGMESPVTRFEIATMIYRELNVLDYDFNGNFEVKFKDYLVPWAEEKVNLMAKEGFIRGFDSETFGGEKGILKQDLGIILMRVKESL